jgi:hypothetical protein
MKPLIEIIFLKKETPIKSPSRFHCLATIKVIKNKQEFINKYILCYNI